MEDKIQLKFEGLIDPKEIWETTKQKFGTHGYLENERLINNIVKLKLSTYKGVQDYCDRFNAALEELSRGSGESMPEEYALVHWFNGLGDKYKIWRAIVHTEFRMRPDNKVKLEELQLQLIDHAASDSKDNGVMLVGANASSGRRKGKGKGKNKKLLSNDQDNDDSKPKCDLCDAAGYEKSKCFYADLSKAP
jgi:gag-polypeptide of LTR copia-type